MSVVQIHLNPGSVDDYARFIRAKSLPKYRMIGSRTVEVPAEYAQSFGVTSSLTTSQYTPPAWMYDYQAGVTSMAIRKRKFSVFMDCGYGKTPIMFEFARHAAGSFNSPALNPIAPRVAGRFAITY